MIPDNWTRYAAIDPGFQRCAVLFGAVPPPELQADIGTLVLYDELYIAKCSASMFADGMMGKTVGHSFYDFILDMRGAGQSSAITGKTIAEQYSEELAKRGVRCRLRGSGFCWGSTDTKGRIESVRGMLNVRGNGIPSLRVLTERADTGQLISSCPNFEAEIARYRNKRVGTVVTDEPETRGAVHLMHCLEYLCAYSPRWVEPPPRIAADGLVYREFLKKKKQEASKLGGVRLGVGRTTS